MSANAVRAGSPGASWGLHSHRGVPRCGAVCAVPCTDMVCCDQGDRAAPEGCEVPGWLDMDMGRDCGRRNISSNWTGCTSNHSRNSFVKQTAWESLCSQPGSLILSGVAGAQAFSGSHGGLALPARRPFPVPLVVAAAAEGRGGSESPPCAAGLSSRHRPSAAAADWQKRRVPATRRRSEAVPCASPQHHDSSG
ncbi:acyl-CoA-binding domain-containing protein 7 isoform X1 [Agelaius tricolor]|uniref:acyl-CoA-binding domain-containing protein 7 isoform X1 n=1 Tax=Agelaius tricolor TaxID=9191 RepID=UPI0039F221AA